jgi:hypothetical protein
MAKCFRFMRGIAVAKPKIQQNQAQDSEESPVSSDRFDMAILRELLTDSRKTLQEIGAAVSLSPTTCCSRIKRLEAEGVIKRYTAARTEPDRAPSGVAREASRARRPSRPRSTAGASPAHQRSSVSPSSPRPAARVPPHAPPCVRVITMHDIYFYA